MTGEIGRPIVVGVDRSASALQATGWAANEAVLHGAPLRLVHDVHVSPLRNVGRSSTFAAFFEALENEGCQYLAEAEAIVRLAQPEIDVDVDLQRTDQVRLLIDWSKAACLLVLGFRGRCPLLVARPVTAG